MQYTCCLSFVILSLTIITLIITLINTKVFIRVVPKEMTDSYLLRFRIKIQCQKIGSQPLFCNYAGGPDVTTYPVL